MNKLFVSLSFLLVSVLCTSCNKDDDETIITIPCEHNLITRIIQVPGSSYTTLHYNSKGQVVESNVVGYSAGSPVKTSYFYKDDVLDYIQMGGFPASVVKVVCNSENLPEIFSFYYEGEEDYPAYRTDSLTWDQNGQLLKIKRVKEYSSDELCEFIYDSKGNASKITYQKNSELSVILTSQFDDKPSMVSCLPLSFALLHYSVPSLSKNNCGFSEHTRMINGQVVSTQTVKSYNAYNEAGYITMERLISQITPGYSTETNMFYCY